MSRSQRLPIRSRRAPLAFGAALVGAGVLLGVSNASWAGTDNATLTLSADVITIGTGQQVTATVDATLGGVQVNNDQATFWSTGDVVFSSKTCTTKTGVCSVTITAGSTYGQQEIYVSVSGLGFSAQGGPAPLFQTDEASTVVVSAPSPGRITPNGLAQTTATATLADTLGRAVPGQHLTWSTSDTTYPVSFGATRDNGNGTYGVTVTAPRSIGCPTSTLPGGGCVAAGQSETQTLTATDSLTGNAGSGSLLVAYPSFHTVAYPLGPPTSGQPSPGLYDDQGRRVRLQGAEGPVLAWNPTGDSGGGYSPSVYQDVIKHMANGGISQAGGITWNFNVMRIALADSYWLSADAADGCGTAYRQAVENYVSEATSYGMVADITLHTDVGGYGTANAALDADPSGLPCLATPQPIATNPPTAPGEPEAMGVADQFSQAFWTSVATTFGAPTINGAPNPNYNPMVVFDLYNEPNTTDGRQIVSTDTPCNGTDPVCAWMYGGVFYNGNYKENESFPGMEQLYSAVRASAPATPVIVSGYGHVYGATDGSGSAFDILPAVKGDPVTGSTTPLVPTTDGNSLAANGSNVGTNVIFANHPYWSGGDCATSSSLGDGDNGVTGSGGDLDTHVAPVAQQYPVIIGEIGYACSPPTLGNNAATYDINWAQQHGIGFVIWHFRRNWSSPDFGILICDASWPAGCGVNQSEYQAYTNATYIFSASTSGTSYSGPTQMLG